MFGCLTTRVQARVKIVTVKIASRSFENIWYWPNKSELYSRIHKVQIKGQEMFVTIQFGII
jgi:hypothetical protein